MAQASGGPSQLASLLESNSKIEDKTSKLASKAAVPEPEPLLEPIAKPPAGPEANGMANGMAKPAPGDEAMIDAVMRSCGGAVTKVHVHKRLPAFRAIMAEGVDFFLDVVPEIQAFARGKKEIANCANRHILAEARAHCSSRLATQGSRRTADATIAKVFRDDPDHADVLDAALARIGKTRKVFFHESSDGYYAKLDRAEWDQAVAAARSRRGSVAPRGDP